MLDETAIIMNRPMKNFALLIGIFLIMPFLVHAQSTDTLIKKRNELYQRHSQRVAMLLDSSQINLTIMVRGLDSLVQADNQILDEGFPALKSEIDTLKAKNEAVVPLSEEQKKLLELYSQYEPYLIPAAAGIAFVILLLLILLIAKSSSSKKKRKKLNKRIKELETLEQSNEALTQELEGTRLAFEKHQNEISEIKSVHAIELKDQVAKTERLQTELNASEEKMRELKSSEDEKLELSRQLQAVNEELQQNRESNNRLNEQLRQLQEQQLMEGQERENLMSSLRNELNQLRMEKNQLEIELSTSRLNATSFEDDQKIREMETKLRDAEDANYRLKDVESDLQRKLKDMENELTEVRNNQRMDNTESSDMMRLKEQLDEARQMLETERKFRNDVEVLLKEILNRKH